MTQVSVDGTNASAGTITIGVDNLGAGVSGNLVYEGACTQAGLRWTISGSVDTKYFPKS